MNIKKALQQFLVIPLIVGLGIIVNAVFPPYYGSGQKLPPDKRQQDTAMSLNEAKQVIEDAKRNADVVKGIEAGKKSEAKSEPAPTKVIVKRVPVVKTRVDTVYRDSVIEKKVIIYKTAPVYKPAEIRYLTFSQWRDSTGLKSEKKYKEYLKTKFK